MVKTEFDFYEKNSITARLKEGERLSITSKMAQIAEGALTALCVDLKENCFQTGFWTSYSCSEWPLIALKAFQVGRISQNQLATVCLFAQAHREFISERKICTMQLDGLSKPCWIVKDNQGSKETRKISVIDSQSAEYDVCIETFFRAWIGKAVIKDAISDITHKSERCFLMVPACLAPIEYWGPMYKAIRLASQNRLNPFIENKIDILGQADERRLVLPSFSILELFARLFNPSLPIELRPRFGAMSKEEIIQDRFQFAHVVGLSIEDSPLPAGADGKYLGPLAFSIHDVYHAHRLSETCPAITIGINRILQIIRELEKTEMLEKLEDVLVDSEFTNDCNYQFGTIFQSVLCRPYWDYEDGLYKKVILEDMVLHQTFWDPILKRAGGLLPQEEFQLEVFQEKISPEDLPIDVLAELFNLPRKFFVSYGAPYIETLQPKDALVLVEEKLKDPTFFEKIDNFIGIISEEDISEVLSWSQVGKLLYLPLKRLTFAGSDGRHKKGLIKYALSKGEYSLDFLQFCSNYLSINCKNEIEAQATFLHIVEKDQIKHILQLQELFISKDLSFCAYETTFLEYVVRYKEQIDFPMTDVEAYFVVDQNDINKTGEIFAIFCRKNIHVTGDITRELASIIRSDLADLRQCSNFSHFLVEEYFKKKLF